MSKPKNDIDPSKSPEEKELLRYLNEEMSSKEKYAFERKAENDPFLYEAMEGLQDMDVKHLAKDLADMKKNLARSENTSFYGFSNVWKIAAVVTLLLVAGFSAWRLTMSPELKENASTETLAADSSVAINSPSPIEMDETEEQADSAKSITDDTSSQQNLVAESQPVETPKPVAEEEKASPQTTGPPVAVADEAELSDEIAVTEETLDLTLADDIEVTQAEESSEGAGLAVQEAERKEIASEPAPQEVTAPKLSEFNAITSADVSTGEAKAKKEVDQSNPPVARSARIAATTQLATPVAGLESFRRYVIDNQQKTADMVSGEVGLSFTLNAEGNPQNIKVTKSLCQPCDQEAIRLLQNGGAWKYNDGVTNSPLTTTTIPISN
jgi:outer membrane biosynthesis protein TonB